MPATPKRDKIVDLVTGGSTGLGAQIINRLLGKGHEVRALLLHNPSANPEWRTLPAGTVPYVADITLTTASNQRVLEDACTGVNNLFHLAAATYNYKHTYDELVNVNVVGTENLLSAYKKVNTELNTHMHFLFASSVSVYGYDRSGETLTEESRLKPQSPYAESKEMAEKVITSFAEAYPKMPYTIFRLGTLYGQGYKESLFKVFRLIEEEKMVYIGSGGTNHLTWIHEEDAADAMCQAASNPKCFNKTYNLTDGVPHTAKELYTLVAKELNVKPPTRSVSKFVGNITRRMVKITFDEFKFVGSDRRIDINRIRNDLNFKPKRSMDVDGIGLVKEFEGLRAKRIA